MKYICITTTSDANGNQATMEYTIDATDARTAHNAAERHKPHGANLRVYPATQDEHGAIISAGVARGALMIARRTAVNAVLRTGGNETQNRIEKELTAANARCCGAETITRIENIIESYSADTQDFYSCAKSGILDGISDGMDIMAQYANGFAALNAHVHAQRAASVYELSTEFLTNNGGDIVSINDVIACIIRGGDKWHSVGNGRMDAKTAARLSEAITAAMCTLTPTQRDVAELLGRRFSQRMIAIKLDRSVSTIEKHIAIIRAKIAEYLRGNASEFVHIMDRLNSESTIYAERAETDGAKWANGCRTAEGEAREKARKSTDEARAAARERMRRIRAERAAAKQNG